MNKQIFMGFLLDAGWVEVIVGVIAIILTVLLYRLTKKKKSVSYEVLSETPLVSISDEIKGKLRMLFNEKPIQNVHLLLIKFINDGNVSVAASDYERPLTLWLEGTSDILSAEFVESAPANLNPSLKINDKVIAFAPTLMNAGDSFTAKVLVGEYSGKFDVDARVLGIKSVRAVSKNERKARLTNRLAYAGAASLLVALVVALLFIINKPPHPQITNIKASELHIFPEGVIRISGSVTPADGEIKYEWKAKRGLINDSGLTGEAVYQAPDSPGPDIIQLRVTDRYGRVDSKDWAFEVTAAPSSSSTPTSSSAVPPSESKDIQMRRELEKRRARMRRELMEIEERLEHLDNALQILPKEELEARPKPRPKRFNQK